MRRIIPCLIFCLILASCITPETRKAIDDQRIAVQAIQAEIAKLHLEGASAEAIAAASLRLEEANSKLDSFEELGIKERVISGAETGAVITESAAPIAAIFVPILGGILAAIGLGFKAIKNKMTGGENA